jgi:glucose uptake protein
MEPAGIVFALATVLAWGTWLAPSENVLLPNPVTRAFYIAVGNFFLAGLVLLAVRGQGQLSGTVFLYPFAGGLVWSLGALCAFSGIARLGMAKAFGLWAPLNILTGVAWGMAFFGEFIRAGAVTLVLAGLALLAIVGGLLLIIFSGGTGGAEGARPGAGAGIACAIAAGVVLATLGGVVLGNLKTGT